MEKLQYKHIENYLRFGLKAKLSREGIFNLDNEYPNEYINEICTITNFNTDFKDCSGSMKVCISKNYSFYFDSLSEIDIILHPLSDLTKEIEVNGKKFVPLRKLEDLFPCVEFYNDDELSYLFSDTDCRGEFFNSIELNLTLEISNKLFEWHFDVFDLHSKGLCIYYNELIGKGLAIDINTL